MHTRRGRVREDLSATRGEERTTRATTCAPPLEKVRASPQPPSLQADFDFGTRVAKLMYQGRSFESTHMFPEYVKKGSSSPVMASFEVGERERVVARVRVIWWDVVCQSPSLRCDERNRMIRPVIAKKPYKSPTRRARARRATPRSLAQARDVDTLNRALGFRKDRRACHLITRTCANCCVHSSHFMSIAASRRTAIPLKMRS